MLNRVVIQGRIGKDIELRHTQSGVSVVSFSIAVDRDFKDKATGEKTTDWVNVTAWRSTAEFVSKYFSKGRMAVVDGKLQTNTWTDKDGNKRSSLEVVADSVYFGDSRKKESEGDTPESDRPEQNGQEVSEVDADGELPF